MVYICDNYFAVNCIILTMVVGEATTKRFIVQTVKHSPEVGEVRIAKCKQKIEWFVYRSYSQTEKVNCISAVN